MLSVLPVTCASQDGMFGCCEKIHLCLGASRHSPRRRHVWSQNIQGIILLPLSLFPPSILPIYIYIFQHRTNTIHPPTTKMPHHPSEENAPDHIFDKVAKESSDSTASDHPTHDENKGPVKATAADHQSKGPQIVESMWTSLLQDSH